MNGSNASPDIFNINYDNIAQTLKQSITGQEKLEQIVIPIIRAEGEKDLELDENQALMLEVLQEYFVKLSLTVQPHPKQIQLGDQLYMVMLCVLFGTPIHHGPRLWRKVFFIFGEDFYDCLHFPLHNGITDQKVRDWKIFRVGKLTFPKNCRESDFFHPFLNKAYSLTVLKCIDPLTKWINENIQIAGIYLHMEDVQKLTQMDWCANNFMDDKISDCQFKTVVYPGKHKH